MKYFRGVFLAILFVGIGAAATFAQTAGTAKTAVKAEPASGEAKVQSKVSGERAAIQQGFAGLSARVTELTGAVRTLVPADETESAAEQREIRDLEAQEEMARWAMWMFIAAGVSVVLSLAGLGLVGATLWYTREAAGYTKGMLDEAKKTTDAAIKTVKADRAWITLKDFTPEGAADYPKSGISSGVMFYPQLINSGRAPAIGCTIYTCAHRAIPGDDIPFFEDVDMNPEEGSKVVGVGEVMSGPAITLKTEYLKLCAAGKLEIYLFTRVVYQTTHGDTAMTETCAKLIIHAKPETLNEPKFATRIFDFNAIGPQNKAT